MKGGCHCGRVTYQVGGRPEHVTICPCADCRRIVGASSVAWLTVPKTGFAWSEGGAASFRSSAKVVRRFCGTCGTSLTYESDDTPEEIDVTVASLDDPDAVSPRDHTFVSERDAWDVIGDGLPRFGKARP